jgi:hypothetical protein
MKAAIIGTGLVMVLAGAGCAIEGADGDAAGEATGEAHQQLGSFGIWSWGCGGSANCSLDLGSTSGQTCFLAGVWGNLQHASTYSQAQVVASGGRWGIQVVPNSHPLGVTAVCVPGATVATATWHSGGAEINLGSGATRRCFLSGILNRTGFTAATDYVQVRKVGTSWFLGGNMTTAKDAIATAVCVDVPSAANDYGLVAGEGSSFLNMQVQPNNPFGWACGIKKLGGHFTTNDYNDGVWFDYNNGISEWELNAVNGKQTTTDCVK